MIGYCIILVLLAIPLGNYIAKVMNGERVFLSGILRPAERGIYRLLKIDENEDMDWKKYSVCTAVFLSLIHIFRGPGRPGRISYGGGPRLSPSPMR